MAVGRVDCLFVGALWLGSVLFVGGPLGPMGIAIAAKAAPTAAPTAVPTVLFVGGPLGPMGIAIAAKAAPTAAPTAVPTVPFVGGPLGPIAAKAAPTAAPTAVPTVPFVGGPLGPIAAKAAPTAAPTAVPTNEGPAKVGVIYVFHGGSDTHSARTSWNATMQIFAYDPNSAVYQRVIWNERIWPAMTQQGNSPKERRKYAFSYGRIGERDPANSLTRTRYRQLAAELEARESELGVDFVVDYANWLAADPKHHIYPRSIYFPGVPNGAAVTYCGSPADGGQGRDGQWPDCDPERYNVDGTIERVLAEGVDAVVMIDMTTSGVRFFKTFDVVNLARLVVQRFEKETGKKVPVWWVNDPTDLMTESYPSHPQRWTRSLGAPEQDREVSMKGRPNPVSSDKRLALVHAEGIESRFGSHRPRDIGIMLINHGTRRHDQNFDPKIDDTVVLNQNIREVLLSRNPSLKAENIVGAWMGRKEFNADLGKYERTRRMRGENLGDAWLYETESLPSGDLGWLYWDALEYLTNQGVSHIVVAFPQIMVDSVLNLVEVPNQIAKEIGFKNWARWSELDFDRYPGVGHPFADYWGMWVETECPTADGTPGECCFEMAGCGPGRPYPPPSTTPAGKPVEDLDPVLAFAVSEFGHVGFDPSRGRPREDGPVQRQYRGTWDLWQPPNDDPRVATLLADLVVDFWRSPPRSPIPEPIPLLPVHEAN